MNTIDITPLVQAFLPRRFYPKAKAIVAGVLTVLNLLGTVLPLLAGAPTWIPVVVAGTVTVLTPVLVYLTGNEDAPVADHAASTGVTAVD